MVSIPESNQRDNLEQVHEDILTSQEEYFSGSNLGYIAKNMNVVIKRVCLSDKCSCIHCRVLPPPKIRNMQVGKAT